MSNNDEQKTGGQDAHVNVEADLQERLEGFNKELAVLLGKFELGIAAVPRFTRDGRISAETTAVSTRGMKAADGKVEDKKQGDLIEG